MPSSRLVRTGGLAGYLAMTTPAVPNATSYIPPMDFTPSVENTPGLITLLGTSSWRVNVPGTYLVGCTFNSLGAAWVAAQGQRVLCGITRNGNAIMRANLPDVGEDLSPSFMRVCKNVLPTDTFQMSLYQITGAARQFVVNCDVTRVA